MKNLIKISIVLLVGVFLFSSCLKDLDKFPINDSTGEKIFKDLAGYKMALAKVYGAMVLTGNNGPAGSGDVQGLDEGFSDFLRCFFNHQELPTDEAHCIWFQDVGITEMDYMNFISSNPFTIGLYSRSLLQIMYANEFLRNCTDAALDKNGITNASDRAEIKYFAAEARFIRAFQYWVLMDVFANPPFVTEDSKFGELPKQTNRKDLFAYVESELIAISDGNLLKAPRSNEYGRIDQATAWALLARLYLNANVYLSPVGTPGNDAQYYTKAITYADKVINSGYSLHTDGYQYLFLNDNDKNNPEVIFSLNYDGVHTKGYGGTTFLIDCASNSGYQTTYKTKLLHYGMIQNANWAGYRVRGNFTDKFDPSDERYLFVGENKYMGELPGDYTYGMATYKYRNISSEVVNLGVAEVDRILANIANEQFGNDPEGKFADNDFPLFRLAEMYLAYAEAVKRGGTGGNEGTALGYLNDLRSRAGLGTISSYDLNYILDERGRELYWECQRRTDLVRFNKFTTADYIWEWKGGVKEGKAVDAHYNIYPIPNTDISANPNLKQNPGY